MFGILRIFIGLVVGLILIAILHKYIKKRIVINVFFLTFFIIAFITALGFIPFENMIYDFKSAEDVYRYYYYGEKQIDMVIKGTECDFVIGEKKNISTYLIVPKTETGWKIGIGLNTKKIFQKVSNGITVYVYQYKNTNDYFISILSSNGGDLEITDSYNSKFFSLEKTSNSYARDFINYYTHISGFDSKYWVSINGSIIELN